MRSKGFPPVKPKITADVLVMVFCFFELGHSDSYCSDFQPMKSLDCSQGQGPFTGDAKNSNHNGSAADMEELALLKYFLKWTRINTDHKKQN
jgi:hypothetical protein